ncbi:hypothetical protein ABIF63_000258 [Bradyrhizobium japonicum]|uniref:Mobilization protein n=1 Tax=Bradyrhizobium japonicum TaxID=375 RepID=A0ABV2RIN0_BRAJP
MAWEGAMAESGSETRQRDERHTVRFSPLEDALICAKANAAGVPVATFLRNTALAFPMPRAARRPTSNHEDVALLLGRIGQLAAAFRSAATLADTQAVETALADLSELRLLSHRPGAQAVTREIRLTGSQAPATAILRGTNVRGRFQ